MVYFLVIQVTGSYFYIKDNYFNINQFSMSSGTRTSKLHRRACQLRDPIMWLVKKSAMVTSLKTSFYRSFEKLLLYWDSKEIKYVKFPLIASIKALSFNTMAFIGHATELRNFPWSQLLSISTRDTRCAQVLIRKFHTGYFGDLSNSV